MSNIFNLVYNSLDPASCLSSHDVSQCVLDSSAGAVLSTWCKETLNAAVDSTATDYQWIKVAILLRHLIDPDELMVRLPDDFYIAEVLEAYLYAFPDTVSS